MVFPKSFLKRWWCSLLLVLCLDLTAKGEDDISRHMTLHVGAAESLSFPVGTDLQVSKRGVVDVFHVGDGRWQLTALHGGFVVIEARDAVNGEIKLPRLLVDVLAAGDESGVAQVLPVPQWLCDAAKTHCDQPSGIVTGEAPSLPWFLRAKAACQTAAGCMMAATLTPALMQSWLADLTQQLGRGFLLKSNEGGQIPLISSYCGKDRDKRRSEADLLSGHLISAGLALFRCSEDEIQISYLLKLRLWSVSTWAAEDVGLNTKLDVQGRIPGSNGVKGVQGEGGLLAKIEALASTHQAEIIGEPVLRLRPGEEVHLVSGGEFQVIEHVINSPREELAPERSSWKQHGIDLSLKAVPLDLATARLHYDLSFKSRTESANDALAVSAMRSEADVPLGVQMMLGILDMGGSEDTEQHLPILSHIPIIGPLLTKQNKQHSKSRLILWAELDQDLGVVSLSDPPQAESHRLLPPPGLVRPLGTAGSPTLHETAGPTTFKELPAR